ncbi:MAG: 3-hydroxyacyl-CoA dehydrogenase/enoyl-CoA hydratase family protein [Acidobacteriia bacterium]|nr:3-hydroxyacyl-CoA dehydrogenase/enoyl-CoA hydratase family protein [Terriglobia bacterium]
MRTIRRVGVLGAGTMGSRIAAHFANAGIPSLLLDIVLPNAADRNAAAKKGIENAAKQRPIGFFTGAGGSLVQPGNFEDHLHLLQECDWIIEAVTENLDIKRALWTKVEIHRHPDAILSTNTSGIPLAQISAGFSPSFRANFLGTHFFNPPRYLHLVEIIPTPATDPHLLALVSNFCDHRLGKGVVLCKDTPNFIANRIGSFFGGTVHKITAEDDYTIEEVDALTGSLIGLPNSASFRLLDIVGLDVWAYVGKNLYEATPHDPWRDRFLPPPFLQELLNRGWLGEKSGQGFYRRTGKGDAKIIEALDRKSLEYHPALRVSFPSVEQARSIESLPERLRALVSSTDRAGAFLWKLFRDLFLYSAERVPEISDRIVEIDRAMRWGYANTLGPFELWDALSFVPTARRMEAEGLHLPPSIVSMLQTGAAGFYRTAGRNAVSHTEYFDLPRSSYEPLEERPGITVLSDLKHAAGVVRKNAGASLIDLGDGVLCLEFHSKMNSLGEDIISMIYSAIEETSNHFEALVIANQGADFCVGANLMLVLLAAQEGDWDELNRAVHRFQQACMAIKCSPKPVVAAPFARTLGGGCEIVLHAAQAQASAELYIGLVEAGVGLIPAGGGCKEMLIRYRDARPAFEQIGFAKVSTSAGDARNLRYLSRTDAVTMNQERLISDAKDAALKLTHSYLAPSPLTAIPTGGDQAFAIMKMGAWMARQGNYISDHDQLIAEKLAHVLSGGRLSGTPAVSEQYLLDLEREAFLSLCGHPKTQQRMQHMLKTGKPLRN